MTLQAPDAVAYANGMIELSHSFDANRFLAAIDRDDSRRWPLTFNSST